MIIKELENIEPTDKFGKAGFFAESQLAFYLRRAFKDDSQIFVFNNLRLERAGDACQIDHLVLHRYGMIVIESKSVTTRVEVNERGEWKREFNSSWQGMPSPILQAQRQGIFLKNYLEANVETLLNKILFGRQAHFTKMPIDVLIAISDSGIIERPKNDKLNMVCKADQIVDKVREIVSEYRKIDSLLSLSLKTAYLFDMDEVPRISNFLLSHHKPAKVKASGNDAMPTISPSVSSPIKNPVISKPIATLPTQKKIIAVDPTPSIRSDISHKPVEKPSVKSTTTTSQYTCSHCQSKNIVIVYAHSYYFKCNDCGKNTALKNICPTCGDREKTRKSALQFFAECGKCNTSRLFHTNSSNL